MRLSINAAGAALLLASLVFATAPARAQTVVSGHVLDAAGTAPAQAIVILSGANRTATATTDREGSFSFGAVADGEYDVFASGSAGVARAHVIVASTPVTVVLRLAPRSLGRVSVSSAAVLRSGGSAVFTGSQLAHSPASDNLSDVLVQMPSAARGSNGQIHMNGDHGDIGYYLDGVPLPQELDRVIGSEVDVSEIGFLDVIEGAYPAKYGDKFGAVVNIATVAGTGAPGGRFTTDFGTQGLGELSLVQHDAVGRGGITVALRSSRTGWALDPPVPDANHDRGSASNAFIRLTLPESATRALNLHISHAYQTFQIPPDTSNGTPSGTDDVETQDDTFVALSDVRTIGARGSFAFGPTLKVSRIRDFPDLANDFAAAPGDNCSGADPSAPQSCLFAALTDRLARDTGAFASYTLGSAHHMVESGVDYDATATAKLYDIYLQPNNFLDPGATTPTLVTDAAPNVAHSVGAYVQDGWGVSTEYRLDYGARYDEFTIASAGFRDGYAQVSPRLKLTRIFDDRTSVYAYYGRLFTPFSFENVSPAVAAELSPGSGASFDLSPERESLYELGGVFELGAARGSWKVAHASIVDVLDDAQVGATNLHQDINFGDGRGDFQVLAFQFPHDDGSRDTVSLTHSRAVNRGCGSRLLSGCAPPPYDWFDADHDQRWDGSFAKELRTRGGDWLTVTSEYGSGLSTGTSCDTCKVPPHWTFDAEYGVHAGARSALVLTVRNLLDDRYAITSNNALQGTHFAQPRAAEVSYRVDY